MSIYRVPNTKQKTNMRLISIPFVLLVCFHVPSTSGAIKCEADHECPTDHYCYKVAGNCSPCINCGTYKRKNSTWQSCTHSVTECEDCLPGYEKEIMTDRKIREKCVPQPKASHFNKSEGVKGGNDPPSIGNLWWWALLTSPVISYVILYISCHQRRARAPRPNIESGIDEVSDGVGAESISLVPHAPPPYTEASMYSNNGDCQCKEVSECLNHTMEVRMEKEDLHQAVPFRDADEHSDTNEITIPPSDPPYIVNNADDEGTIENEIDFVVLDEETRPCDWTPHRPEDNTASPSTANEESAQITCSDDSCEPPEPKIRRFSDVNSSRFNIIDIQVNNVLYINNLQSG